VDFEDRSRNSGCARFAARPLDCRCVRAPLNRKRVGVGDHVHNAILEAQISPHGGEADVQFQLVTDPEEYLPEIFCPYPPPESTPICLGEGAEGALPILTIFKEAHLSKVDISEDFGITLTPNTTYHYRALAARAIFGEDTIEWEPPIVIGADQTFTTLSETPAGPPLTLNIEEGSGTVASDPAGIECIGSAPKECTTEEIAEDEIVTLTASPAAGFLFKGWRYCDSKSVVPGVTGVEGRKCTIKLTEGHKPVGATFAPAFDLTLENSGGGQVYSRPGGALCMPNCIETTASFQAGKSVEVLTKPNKHFHLVEFGGDCSGKTCTGLEANSTVSATFAEDTKYALSLAKAGGGQGLVKSTPAGLNCTYTCSGQTVDFYENEVLTIGWKLGKGTGSIAFSSEAGTCPAESEAAEGSCTIEMNEAHSFVADFE
jgi:hypothetical protein